MLEHLPIPKVPLTLPTVLTQEKVQRIIEAASNLMHRTIIMMLYSTGTRRGELGQLKVSDVDSERKVIRSRVGKGSKDRDVPLSETLLETLREYWRWMKPIDAKAFWSCLTAAGRCCSSTNLSTQQILFGSPDRESFFDAS
jgi:integrase